MAVRRILVSQPAPKDEQKSPFSMLQERYNLTIDYKQFLTVEGATLKEFISQRKNILDHTAVVFTSRLLIDIFFRLVGESRITIPEGMKYFCSSETIALYLQKYITYRKRKVFFATGSVTSLMEMILKHNSEKYLVPLSEPHKPEIPMAMERADLQHSLVILSHTRPSDLSNIDSSSYDIVALYSPAEIKNFQENFLAKGYQGKLAAFGESTAKAALAEGLTVDMMAPSPKHPSMAAVISSYCKAELRGDDLSEFQVACITHDTHSELLKMAEKRKCKSRKSSSAAAKSSSSSVSASSSKSIKSSSTRSTSSSTRVSASAKISTRSTTTRSATPRSVSMSSNKTLVGKSSSTDKK